ncbi:hypothetical protein F2P79_019556 [Pimephales promelas]|nr:hypothetical protein F2P79_019556 [Pimephales promelas]
MLLLVFTIVSLLKENAAADTLTPFFTEKHVLEGKDVTLICNYTGNVQSLQWYRQYPGSKPENIILYFETSPKSEPSLRLTAVADRVIKREANGNAIRANQPSEVLTEGSSITLSCTYESGSAYSLHWYRQMPGSTLEFLLLIVKSTNLSPSFLSFAV